MEEWGVGERRSRKRRRTKEEERRREGKGSQQLTGRRGRSGRYRENPEEQELEGKPAGVKPCRGFRCRQTTKARATRCHLRPGLPRMSSQTDNV